MARYIDADLLVEKLEQHFDVMRDEDGRLLYSDHVCTGEDCDDLLKLVNAMPTADVAEVVRCEKCEYKDDCEGRVVHTTRDYVLEQNISTYNKVDFCSCGKRKEDV